MRKDFVGISLSVLILVQDSSTRTARVCTSHSGFGLGDDFNLRREGISVANCLVSGVGLREDPFELSLTPGVGLAG